MQNFRTQDDDDMAFLQAFEALDRIEHEYYDENLFETIFKPRTAPTQYQAKRKEIE
jgi:hypothetical protein